MYLGALNPPRSIDSFISTPVLSCFVNYLRHILGLKTE